MSSVTTGIKVTMTSDCIINHWLLDISSASLVHRDSGEQRRLGEYQLKLLVVLVQHAGQILSREELNQLVWERRVIGNNSLPNAVHALRVALEDDGRQQRIIKTIPKKGYILEAEFCQFQPRVSEEEDEIEAQHGAQRLSMTPPPVSVQPVIAEEGEEAKKIAPDIHLEAPAPLQAKPVNTRWIKVFTATLVLLIALAAVIIYTFSQQKPGFVLQPIEGVKQSRVLQLINTPRDQSTAKIDMSGLIGPALRDLETTLQKSNVHMDAYYSAAGPTLNLTLNLKSDCAHQQLAMTIFYASESPAELRELIKVETERKLNELAPCNP
jgi:DNA-binding winged helix-turn-helix (wHTH) protein